MLTELNSPSGLSLDGDQANSQSLSPHPLRILHVFEPSTGGIPVFVSRLAVQQHSDGHNVHVLGPRDALRSGIFPGDTIEPHEWQMRRRPGAMVAARRTLLTTIGEVRPDVLHLHSFFAGLVGRVRRIRGLATIYQPNAWPFNLPGPSGRAALWLERWMAPRTHIVAAVAEDEVKQAETVGLKVPTVVTSTSVDLKRFSLVSTEERQSFRRELHLDDSFIALCVGRICHQKGQDQLIEAWRRRNPVGVRLVLVGEGSEGDLSRLKTMAEGLRVSFVGGQTDVRPWIWAADVLIQPSRWEGLSIAVAEALACGTPVLATDVPGMRNAIQDGFPEAGAIVSPGDMDALIDELLHRVRKPAVVEKERVNARRRATSLFDPAAVAKRVERAYEFALSRAAGSNPYA